MRASWSVGHLFSRYLKPFLIAPLLLFGVLALVACQQEEKPRWNVLLVTFDTTRADFIGSYGKETANTPTLDGMAARGVLFEQALSSNPVTQPAHSTILTGTYPLSHGVRDNGLFKLPDASETLAEILAANGYRTGAAIGGFPLVKSFGLNQGFDFYDDHLTAVREDHRGRPAARDRDTWYDERPAGHVNDAILPWLRESSDKPFFVWLHYWDPHHPHIAPPPYGEEYAHDPYQGEIAYADQSLGVILRELEFRGELDRTIIIMTSDHGESRGEHYEETHAFLAYDPTLHVPLIMQIPEGPRGNRVTERVGTVDIVPTVLDALNIEAPAAIQGRSLLELANQPSEKEPRNRQRYYSESMSPRLSHGYFGDLRALYWGPYKYIHGPRAELFNLSTDPGELHDLIDTEPDLVQEMETGLVDFLNQHASPVAVGATHDFDEGVRRKLAALGYLSTGGDNDTTVDESLRTDGIPPQDRVGDINLQQRLRQLLSNGQFEQARQTLLQLLESYPQSAYFESRLAQVYLGLKDSAAAAALVDSTASIEIGHVKDYLAVSEALFKAGEHNRALAMAERIAQSEETAPAFLTLARMHKELDQEDAFESSVQRALELEPTNLNARLRLAQHHVESGNFIVADALLVTLLGEYPIHPEINSSYAQMLSKTNQAEQALSTLDRSLVLWPGNCEAHLQRLELLIDNGHTVRIEPANQTLRKSCRDEQFLSRVKELLEKNNAI